MSNFLLIICLIKPSGWMTLEDWLGVGLVQGKPGFVSQGLSGLISSVGHLATAYL